MPHRLTIALWSCVCLFVLSDLTLFFDRQFIDHTWLIYDPCLRPSITQVCVVRLTKFSSSERVWEQLFDYHWGDVAATWLIYFFHLATYFFISYTCIFFFPLFYHYTMDRIYHWCFYVNGDGTRKIIVNNENFLVRTNKYF